MYPCNPGTHSTARLANATARSASAGAIGSSPPRYWKRPSSLRRCKHGTSGKMPAAPTSSATLAATPGTNSCRIIGPVCPSAARFAFAQARSKVFRSRNVAVEPHPSRGFHTTGNASHAVGSRVLVAGVGMPRSRQWSASAALSAVK